MGLGEKARMNIAESTYDGLTIANYEAISAQTDQLTGDALTSVRLGLFGEVGSLMATLKKYHREGSAYAAYKDDVIDEFGDTLWYFSALCRRLGYSLEQIAELASQGDDVNSHISTSVLPVGPVASIRTFANLVRIEELLVRLGQQSATLLAPIRGSRKNKDQLVAFFQAYLRAIQSSEISLSDIASKNLAKVRSRFLNYDRSTLPDFDTEFPEEEQLPKQFEIEIKQRGTGKCYLRWNGVFIGEPLTDNIEDSDYYRFHDVFHFAHAAILHWSPTFRALIRQKRKSDKNTDENQDGGRAIVVEEGLTAYVFTCAKALKFFEDHDAISFSLLKTIQNFVRGYEVEQCPLKLWEDAILRGYDVFRQLRENGGGVILGDRENRTIAYERLDS